MGSTHEWECGIHPLSVRIGVPACAHHCSTFPHEYARPSWFMVLSSHNVPLHPSDDNDNGDKQQWWQG